VPHALVGERLLEDVDLEGDGVDARKDWRSMFGFALIRWMSWVGSFTATSTSPRSRAATRACSSGIVRYFRESAHGWDPIHCGFRTRTAVSPSHDRSM
jgi:hypothetical protein